MPFGSFEKHSSCTSRSAQCQGKNALLWRTATATDEEEYRQIQDLSHKLYIPMSDAYLCLLKRIVEHLQLGLPIGLYKKKSYPFIYQMMLFPSMP